MICKLCGAPADEGDRFCSVCGAPLEAGPGGDLPPRSPGSSPAAEAAPAPARKVPNRRLLLLSSLGALAALAVLIAAVLLRAPGGAGPDFPPLSPDCLYVAAAPAGGGLSIHAGPRPVAVISDPISFDYSADLQTLACVDGDGVLWLVTPDGAERAASGVRYAALSDGGNTVAYQDADGASCLMDLSTGAVSPLDGGLRFPPVFSPDGGSAACSADLPSGGRDALFLYRADGSATEVCAGGLPISLTDGGLLYYLVPGDAAYEGDLYAYRDGGSTLIASGVNPLSGFTSSRDHRELLFFSGDKSYWVRDGSRLVLLAEEGWLFPLAPSGSLPRHSASDLMITTSPASTYVGTALYTYSGGLYYLEEDLACRDLSVSGGASFTLSADGNSLLYSVSGDGLYLLPDLRGGGPPRLLAPLEGDCTYSASADLSAVYYQESGGGTSALRALDPGGESFAVAGRADSFLVSLYSGMLYYIADGELYCLPPGESAPQRVELSGTPAALAYSGGSRLLCMCSGETSDYRYFCEESPGVFTAEPAS